VPVWDVRPFSERLAEPCYIPGSRSVVMDARQAMALPWHKILSTVPYVVLVCLTGRRTGVIASELWAAGQERVLQLQGGILEWQAGGLPLIVPPAQALPEWANVDSLEDLRRAATACFVAESVWLSEVRRNEAFVNPKLLVESVLHEPGALDTVERALCTLDLLAENMRRLGHPVDRLGSTVNALRSAIERLGQNGVIG
jgi:rhodanese-related sulfurtransferase